MSRTKGVLQKVGPGDARWTVSGSPALPERFQEIRDGQLRAVEEVKRAFDRGCKVVWLDAPTGSGKSLAGELVRRRMQVEKGLYICTTKALQDQYVGDFDYARVLKGVTNYLPSGVGWRQSMGTRQETGARLTCGDCDRGPTRVPMDEQTCTYCADVAWCPYQVAKREALGAPVGVLNTAYALAEWNGPGRWSKRELVIADEADLLEQSLMGFVELKLGGRLVKGLGLEVPKKGSHHKTIRAWLEEEFLVALRADVGARRKDQSVEGRRMVERLTRVVGQVERVVKREEGWCRDNDDEERDERYGGAGGGLVLKPVSVEDVGEEYLWRHADRWLCMTGTLVSAEVEAEALGLEEAGIKWDVVTMDMEFPREDRRVVYVPAGGMTRKEEEQGKPRVFKALEKVLKKHPDGNVLIHTWTYKLARETVEYLKAQGWGAMRPIITYQDGKGKDAALERFKREGLKRARQEGMGAIMVAASMDRGVDLPGDECRVQVVLKVPMASLGDRQVSERLRAPGGQRWYLQGTVRSVLQMTGRAVRYKGDWAVCYVLDKHFGKVYKDGKGSGMWPEWWIEGLEVGMVGEYVGN